MRVCIAALVGLTTAGISGCGVHLNPLDQATLVSNSQLQLDTVAADQDPVTHQIDLHEAIARALKYNLDLRVQEEQASLRAAELDLAHYSLLPSAAASAGYAARDNQSAASSFNLSTKQQNFGNSTSQDREIRTADVVFGWNILDFGLSYIRARQAADKVLIAREMRKKATLRLVEEVRTAFWRTAAHEKLFRKLGPLDERLWDQVENNRAIANAHETSPITALTAERELISIRRLLKELESELLSSRSKLAQLMNIPPGTSFSVSAHEARPTELETPADGVELYEIALRDRSELRENLYQQRINLHEARAALLELLPGIQLYGGGNFDSNSFILHNNWMAWGAKAGWNLLKVFQYPARRHLVEQNDQVLKTQALALTMAILTQVELSQVRLAFHKDELALANAQRSVQRRLLRQLKHEKAAGRVSGQTVLREKLQLLIDEANWDISFGDLQNAHANLIASIGGDPFGLIDKTLPVDLIAMALRGGVIERGETVEVSSAKSPVRIAASMD